MEWSGGGNGTTVIAKSISILKNNEISEKQMEKIIYFAIAIKRIKYLGINLRYVKNL